MLPGKVPPDVLDRIVFAHLGKKDKDLLLGPSIGEDASLIRVGEVVIVAATDPITGSVEDIGWLAVHINANDVATFGVRPRWFLASIMLPTGFQEDDLERIMSQIHEAALSLDITVAGGHTEITDGIDRPIVAGFMMGVTTEGSYVTSAGAKPGNAIMMSKTAAIEGTAILATEGSSLLAPLISKQTVENAISLRSQISVVEDGVIAFETGHITAMHDPTEGGLLGGIHEICDASQVGFELDLDSIPISDSTLDICNALSVNVLELISSGCMVMTCAPKGTESVISALKSKGIGATIIGRITANPADRKGILDGDSRDMPRPKTDAIWSALKKINQT
ncbi:MAG: AIR synthase family protein [Candidatus Thorarchaeota archaeon]